MGESFSNGFSNEISLRDDRTVNGLKLTVETSSIIRNSLIIHEYLRSNFRTTVSPIHSTGDLNPELLALLAGEFPYRRCFWNSHKPRLMSRD